jgi:hypothetical protein
MERAGIFCACCGRVFGHDDRGTYIGYEIFCKSCLEYHRRKGRAGTKVAADEV